MTCTPRCQDQHPGQLRQGSVVLTTSPLNIDDTVPVVFIVLHSFSAVTCLAAFTVFASLFGGLCVVSEEWKWNKSLFFFQTFPLCLLHSTLLPLPWPHLFFTSPYSVYLFLSCFSSLSHAYSHNPAFFLTLSFLPTLDFCSFLLLALNSFLPSEMLCGVGDCWPYLQKTK